jgi:hypothetical protein
MAKAIQAPQFHIPYRYQYAVKFICMSDVPGTSQQSSGLLPGNYSTSVNIHNPNREVNKLRSKLAFPGGISKWLEDGLKDDQVKQISCANVKKYDLHLIHGFEGFLVIESTYELDVVAVYTAAPLGEGVSSIDVERVPARRI